MFSVRTMGPEDFEFAVGITDRMNWGMSVADFEFMTELESDGCFILLENSHRIGLATTINYGKVAWFGNLFVDESQRRKGGGSFLVEHSIRYLTMRHAETIGLYAYLDRIPFYRRLGFQNSLEFKVLKGKGASFLVESTVREAGRQDLDEIVEFDESCFGASREKLLEPIISDADNLCYLSTQGRRVVGYAVAKVYGQMGEIGPLVCEKGRGDVAISLLRAILNRLNGYEVTIFVPTDEKVVLDVLNKLRFAESFRVARMFHGPTITSDCILVAESLERG